MFGKVAVAPARALVSRCASREVVRDVPSRGNRLVARARAPNPDDDDEDVNEFDVRESEMDVEWVETAEDTEQAAPARQTRNVTTSQRAPQARAPAQDSSDQSVTIAAATSVVLLALGGLWWWKRQQGAGDTAGDDAVGPVRHS